MDPGVPPKCELAKSLFSFIFMTMKKLILLLLFVTSCSTFKSGLTIPANETFILGRRIELGDEKQTKDVVVPKGKRITRESGNIFLKASKNGLSGISAIQAAFVSPSKKALTIGGEFKGGL